jgi:hypothetical protein
MPSVSPVRLFRRLVPVLPIALLYGCSDAPSPVGPSVIELPLFTVGTASIVTNTDDAGPGSLRQAIIDAPAGTKIQFDAAIAGQTIVLSSGVLDIDKALIIEGPPEGMTVSGGLVDRVFWIHDDIAATLRNLSIVNGRSTFGAGIMDHGTLTLDHSLLANNDGSELGGGIYVPPNLGAELVLVNSTVSGNRGRRGGGIASYGLVVSRNSTIAQNTALAAGGILGGEGLLSLTNTIIAENVDSEPLGDLAPNCQFGPILVTIFGGRNLADDKSCGTDATMIFGASGLAPLANNGGPTKTHAIVSGNPIDAGTACTEDTDQRYVARNQGSSCDIGAFEFDDYGTITIALNPNASVNSKTGIATVSGTVACSASTTAVLDIEMSQTQKSTGRFTTIVKGNGGVSVPACSSSPSSWSIAIAPATGKFQTGSATGTATSSLVGTFLPSTVTRSLKVFQLK